MTRQPIVLLAATAAAAALACSAPEVPTQVIPDAPARASSTPGPSLQLTTTMDHTRLAPGVRVAYGVELRNTGSNPVQVTPEGPCNPSLLVDLTDQAGHIVWSQPVPLCAAMLPPGPTYHLTPGQSLKATRCFSLEPTPSSPCSLLDVPAGTYLVTGNFHGHPLPQMQLRVADHQRVNYGAPGPGVKATAVPGSTTTK